MNFYYISRGSVTETQNHLEYGKRVGYLKGPDLIKLDEILIKLYNDVNKIIVTLRNSKKI